MCRAGPSRGSASALSGPPGHSGVQEEALRLGKTVPVCINSTNPSFISPVPLSLNWEA